jgi:hypothetical protein
VDTNKVEHQIETTKSQNKLFFSILNVSAIVLANLCVSYIMTSQNEEAEELMRKIEKEEEQLAYEDPDKKVFHLCIVNLVIGEHNYQLNKTCLIRFPVLLVKATNRNF